MRELFTRLVSPYLCDYPKQLAYMWQASEYRTAELLGWWFRITNFRSFTKRGELIPTAAGKLVRFVVTVIGAAYVVLNALIITIVLHTNVLRSAWIIGALLLYPITVVIISILPVWMLRFFVHEPKRRRLITRARAVFRNHPGIVVAVAGSYGKTTMKELLAQVIGSEKRIAFTEGNKNVLISQARFGLSLSGDEDVVIVEFGEGQPKDIQKMTELVQPDYAFITGLAPNHLDKYKTLDAISEDFLSLAHHVGADNLFYNSESRELKALLDGKGTGYSVQGCGDTVVDNYTVHVDKTLIILGDKQSIESGLIGAHNVGPISAAAHFAKLLGVGEVSIRDSIHAVRPYEHRLEPRMLNSGWLIDDTYNGSIEGMRAGLAYLRAVEGKNRKIYVTPGLVDQGDETVRVHEELGRLIAEAKPDAVYLFNNSVAEIIQNGLTQGRYEGKVTVVQNPLEFYQNIGDIIAAGDIVLCQNDWPDFYN